MERERGDRFARWPHLSEKQDSILPACVYVQPSVARHGALRRCFDRWPSTLGYGERKYVVDLDRGARTRTGVHRCEFVVLVVVGGLPLPYD